MSLLLRCKISSDVQDLNELHKERWWIPNENMIRPCEKILEDKRKFSKNILESWVSFRDFILDKYFGYPTYIQNGLLVVDDSGKQEEWGLRTSLFPYNLPEGVHHYILWNSKYDYFCHFDELKINGIITDCLTNMLGCDNFDFAWYINPTPSIPELWHCQVFWIRL
jgi:hypothetical protein